LKRKKWLAEKLVILCGGLIADTNTEQRYREGGEGHLSISAGRGSPHTRKNEVRKSMPKGEISLSESRIKEYQHSKKLEDLIVSWEMLPKGLNLFETLMDGSYAVKGGFSLPFRAGKGKKNSEYTQSRGSGKGEGDQ